MPINSRTSKFVTLLAYLVLLLFIYFNTLSWLVTHDWLRGDFNYCYLIPVIVLYLLWEKRKVFIGGDYSWGGFPPLAIGILLFWVGELSGEFFSQYISLWLVIVGITWIHLGRGKLEEIWFPMVLILAMFPPPQFLTNRLTLKLKLLSSQLGVWLMQVWGMSAYREGNIIDLGFTQLQVVDACSGLRYLFPLIVLGILLAYFYKAKFWKKAIIVLSTIPLSIITNSLRIALTGLLYEVWGAKVAEGFFHGFSGWFIFMFSFLILILEMKVLSFKFYVLGKTKDGAHGVRKARKVANDGGGRSVLGVKFYVLGKTGGRKQEERETGEEGGGRSQQAEKTNLESKAGIAVADNLKPKTFPAQFIVAVILLGVTLLISHTVDFRQRIPINKPFDQFPLKIGKWTGTRLTMEQKFIDTLDLSDYIMVDYRDPQGKSVDLYVAYYQTQSKGKSIHSPSTCLPGSGWIFNQAGVTTIPTPGYDGGAIPVRRVYMEKSGFREVAFYWFPARGRILTNAYQLKIYNFWDALTKHRTDGALVRVITPVYNGESPTQAEKRLREFVRDVVPVLDHFLPS